MAIIVGVDIVTLKGDIQSFTEKLGGKFALVADEHKGCIGHMLGDQWINIIVLRKIFKDRLGGKIDKAVCRDSQRLLCHGANRRLWWAIA